MKKQNEKKLSLARETVRDLQAIELTSLAQVAGGVSITGTCYDCPTYTKPTTGGHNIM